MIAANAARSLCGWGALGALLVVACSKGVTDEAISASPGVPTGPCSDEGEIQSCYPGAPETQSIGVCHDGTVTCIEGQWSDCDGYQGPEAEGCSDQIDNDCDGLVDEGCGCEQGATQKCYGGSPTTVGIGECQAGIQSCIGGLWSSSCDSEVLPTTETCDGLDEDCNGVTDDGCGCGDSQCDSGEDCNSCPSDCGACPPTCGDNQCNGTETCTSCNVDCGWGTTGEDGDPCPNVPLETWRCVLIQSYLSYGSQVCTTDPWHCVSPAQPCWVTHHVPMPGGCANCCGSYTAACD